MSSEPVELEGVQVREYRGEKLSSVNDFRENSINGPQYVNESAYTLSVTGLVDEPRTYTYREVLTHQSYSKVVRLDCVEGWSVNILWEGVLVEDLLEDAGIQDGANTVVFVAEDGYTTTLPISYLKDNDILLAYKMNNVTLPPERGYPFHLVAQDKWGYKWIKWVAALQVTDDPTIRGYWESRGYSQNGSLLLSRYE